MILVPAIFLLLLMLILDDPVLISAAYIGLLAVFLGCLIYVLLERKGFYKWWLWASVLISGFVVFFGYSGNPKIMVSDVCEAVNNCRSADCHFVSSGGVDFRRWSSAEERVSNPRSVVFVVRRGLLVRGYLGVRQESDHDFWIWHGNFVSVNGVRNGSNMVCSGGH